MKGIIIENSLKDPNVLNDVEIVRSWEEGSWKLHEVHVSKEQAERFSDYLAEGLWYVHFWEPGNDDVFVVYKDKSFTIKHSDKSTWTDAVEHGKSMGIPDEQLDFLIE